MTRPPPAAAPVTARPAPPAVPVRAVPAPPDGVPPPHPAPRTPRVPAGPLLVLAADVVVVAGAGAYTAAGLTGLAVAGAGVAGAGVAQRRAVRRARSGAAPYGVAGTGRTVPARSLAGSSTGARRPRPVGTGSGAGAAGKGRGGRTGTTADHRTIAPSSRRTGTPPVPRALRRTAARTGTAAFAPARRRHGAPSRTGTAARAATGALARTARRTGRAVGGAYGDARRATRASRGRAAFAVARRPGGTVPRRALATGFVALAMGRRGLGRAVRKLFRAAWRLLRALWRRLRRRSPAGVGPGVSGQVAKPAAANGKVLGKPAPPATPAPSPPVPNPAARPQPAPAGNPEGVPVSKFAPAQHLEDAFAAMAKYAPADMFEFVAHLGELPKMADNFAKTIRTLAVKTQSDLPAARSVTDLLYAMAQVGAAASRAAEEIQPAARRAHEADLARREAPRPGEKLWNV